MFILNIFISADIEKLHRLEDLIERLSLEKEDLANSFEMASLELDEAKAKIKELQESVELLELEAEEKILSSGNYLYLIKIINTLNRG